MSYLVKKMRNLSKIVLKMTGSFQVINKKDAKSSISELNQMKTNEICLPHASAYLVADHLIQAIVCVINSVRDPVVGNTFWLYYPLPSCCCNT